MTDAEALDWLDRLLSADEAEREASLSSLRASNPLMHARLQRMLTSALSPEISQAFSVPVLEGMAQFADATRAVAAGDVFAGYRLIRELGRGGMSVVWLAERADGVVKRQVALKMPLFRLIGALDAERFARERDALAALTHPNVARLFDAGVTESGQPFIVLEHVAGENLTEYCDSRRMDLRARVRLFLQVLAAVDHAHRHLVVHRDLKPSNILVDAEGQVRLLDFGIAKLLGQGDTAAVTQQAGGAMTPLYAAPEQIRGATISTLTDVFSLGVVLHELLTGTLPYGTPRARTTIVEILELLSRGELPRASQSSIDENSAAARGQPGVARLRAALGGDLDTVVGKALRLAPENRYASAAHLADDLRRWLDLQPVAARRPSPWYVIRLALRRHRLAATVAGVGVALVAGASVVALMQFQESRANAERTAAVRDFMFDLVNDAEAREGQQGEITGRQMLDGAVLRARREFAGEPQLQGELLAELGRMYLRLDSPGSAVPVLEEAVRILERNAPAANPALNKSRGFLAGALMRTGGDQERIASLARAARSACEAETTECFKARSYAGNLLSQVAARAGDPATALTESRRFVADTERGFGPRHAETAMALMSLAITARNAGELREADAVIKRAVDTASGLRLRAVDRAQLERTMALIDLELGRYEQARRQLVALIQSTESTSERALQWRILAHLQAEAGDGDAAIQAADSGMALLSARSGPESRLFLRQARARGLAMTGRAGEGIAELDAVVAGLIAGGRKPDSIEVLRARRYRAESLLLAQRDDEALTELRQLRLMHGTARVSAVERGLLLSLLGKAESRAGDARAAEAVHQAAQTALAEQLPEGHPYLTKNAALPSARQ